MKTVLRAQRCRRGKSDIGQKRWPLASQEIGSFVVVNNVEPLHVPSQLLFTLGIMNTSKLYSYVVDHNHGFAPNLFGMYCTLVHCKFAKPRGKRNLVEIANVGDWVLGTGGKAQTARAMARSFT